MQIQSCFKVFILTLDLKIENINFLQRVWESVHHRPSMWVRLTTHTYTKTQKNQEQKRDSSSRQTGWESGSTSVQVLLRVRGFFILRDWNTSQIKDFLCIWAQAHLVTHNMGKYKVLIDFTLNLIILCLRFENHCFGVLNAFSKFLILSTLYNLILYQLKHK